MAHGMLADTQETVEQLFDRFAVTAKRFSTNVSLKKTEVLYQSYPTTKSATATVVARSTS